MDFLESEGLEKKKKKKNRKKKKKKQQIDAEMKANGFPNFAGLELDSLLSALLPDESREETDCYCGLINFKNHLECVFSALRPTKSSPPKLFNALASYAIDRDIPNEVHKLACTWIQHRHDESLKSTILQALDCIVTVLEVEKVGFGGSKSQAIKFLVVLLILRQKPDILVSILPIWKDHSKFHGQSKLPLMAWMTMQAGQGDLTIGLYVWAREFLPLLATKSKSTLECKELVLQIVENILSAPNAKKILVEGCISKGERLFPLSALELLLHMSFPTAPVEETARFMTIYPTLMEVAAASKTRSDRKKLAIQIQDLGLRIIRKDNAKLSDVGAGFFIASLHHNPMCYKRWDGFYEENVEKNVAILRKLKIKWAYLGTRDILIDSLKGFREKNKKALLKVGKDYASEASLIEAEKLCEELLRSISMGRFGVVRSISLWWNHGRHGVVVCFLDCFMRLLRLLVFPILLCVLFHHFGLIG